MRMLGLFIVVRSCPLVEQVSSLWSKSHPCRASFLLVEQVSFLWSKSHPCRASLLLVEQVSSLLSKFHPCWASLILAEQVSSLWSKSHSCGASLILAEQVFSLWSKFSRIWNLVGKSGPSFCQGPHIKNGLYLLWARGHGPVGLAKPYLIFYPLQLPPSPHLVRRFCANGQLRWRSKQTIMVVMYSWGWRIGINER